MAFRKSIQTLSTWNTAIIAELHLQLVDVVSICEFQLAESILQEGQADAQKWLEIGATIEDAEAWIGDGWTTSEAIRSIKRQLNL